MVFTFELGSVASLLAVLASLIVALITWRNVTRQVTAQKQLHADLLAHQKEQDERRWNREQAVRYGVQRLDAYSDFTHASDSLAYMACRALQGLETINPAGRTYDDLVGQYAHATHLIDLLATEAVREAAKAVQQVVVLLTSAEGTERPLEEYEQIYESLRPLRDRFMTVCRAEVASAIPDLA